MLISPQTINSKGTISRQLLIKRRSTAMPNNHHLHILQHSLGVNQYGKGHQYRNHFCTGKGSKDFEPCKELVAKGLMKEGNGGSLIGSDSIFHVTPAGIEFVAANSPPEPKMTQSQKRYRAYLRSECSCSFAEWLGIKKVINV